MSDDNLGNDIMELLGVPDLQDFLSGPYLVELALSFMGLNKPVYGKNLKIGKVPIGRFAAFTFSFMVNVSNG